MRRLLPAVALVLALSASPAFGQSFVIGTGGQPGVTVDGAGNVLVAYKVDTYGPADAVELCVVAPRARSCGIRTRAAFPGEGYNINPVGVHVLPDGGVVLVTGRNLSPNNGVFAAISRDGGRSFGPARAITQGFSGPSVLRPDGRLGLVTDGAPAMLASIPRLDGADAGRDRAELNDFAPYTSITTVPGGTVAAGSAAGGSRAWLLPDGADGFSPAAWQLLPPLSSGRQPQVAGGRAGLGVLLEGDNTTLHFRRLAGARFTRRRNLDVSSSNDGFDLTQDGRGRLFAAWADSPISASRTRVEAARSTDRGATWSSVAPLARTRLDSYGDGVQVAVGANGRGAVVMYDETSTELQNTGPVLFARLSPQRIPHPRRRVGRALVSLRAARDPHCINEANATTRIQASVGSRPVRVSRYVRRASFRSRARRLGGGSATSARYLLRRAPTRVTARVFPRRGRAFTLRAPMRGCL